MVDETRHLKNGTATVGVQSQYTGIADRIENAQVAVYLVYSAARGHAVIGRALYVSLSWTEDPDRCRSAGIPEDLAFASKPQPEAPGSACRPKRVERASGATTSAQVDIHDPADRPHRFTGLLVVLVGSGAVSNQQGRGDGTTGEGPQADGAGGAEA